MPNCKRDYLVTSQLLGKNVIDCCTSSNIDDSVIKFIKKTIQQTDLAEKISKYPDINFSKIKILLKQIFGDGNYLIGSGSEDFIVKINLLSKLISKNIVILEPTFYRTYCGIKHFKNISYDELFKNEFTKDEICWVNNPNSINSTYLQKNDLLKIIKKFPKTIFVIDETSIFYLRDWKKKTLFSEAKENKNLIVISSLSKYFGLPGLRFGFCSLCDNFFNDLMDISATFPINSITNEIAINILKNINKFETIKNEISKSKNKIIKILNSNSDIEITASDLNFIWCKSKDKKNLYSIFLKNGILTFKRKTVSSNQSIRITIHSSNSINQKLIIKLKKINQQYEKY